MYSGARKCQQPLLEAGGYPDDLQTLTGWESEQMLRRYTKATTVAGGYPAGKQTFTPYSL